MHKKFSKILAFILALCFSLGLYGASVLADNGDPDPDTRGSGNYDFNPELEDDGLYENAFTLTLVPKGTTDKLHNDIVDIDVSSPSAVSTVDVDLILGNTYGSDLVVTAFHIMLEELPAGLTFSSFTANTSDGWEGKIWDSDDYRVINYTSNDYSAGSIPVPAGGEVKLGTLTLVVDKPNDASALRYGQILTIGLDKQIKSDFHVDGSVTDSFAALTDGQVEVATTYNISFTGLDGPDESIVVGVNETPSVDDPLKEGSVFMGWSPAITAATEDTTYTALWSINGSVVFADYAYSGSNRVLMLVGLTEEPAEGSALYYNDVALFSTDNQYYLKLLNAKAGDYPVESFGKEETSYQTAYLYIIPNSSDLDALRTEVMSKLRVAEGENVAIKRNGNVNLDNTIDSGDFGIVDSILAGRPSSATIQMRLEADTFTSEYDRTSQFGSIQDIVEIINKL